MRSFMKLTLTLLLLTPAVRAQDDPKAILTKAIAAHGGAENLVKQNISRVRSSGTVSVQGMELPFTAETLEQLPDKIKTTLTVTVQGQQLVQVQVLNGDKAWLQVFGQTTEVPGNFLKEMKETVHASQCQTLVPLLREADYKLVPLPEMKVKNRAAVGFKVSAAGRRDVSLYFDKETGLLVKVERKAMNPQQAEGKEIFRETFLSDYKDVDGVKTATKAILLNDGQPYVNSIITETHFPNKLDPKVFDRP